MAWRAVAAEHESTASSRQGRQAARWSVEDRKAHDRHRAHVGIAPRAKRTTEAIARCRDHVFVYVYADDHNPPHLHAIHGDDMAEIEISTEDLLVGRLPGPWRAAWNRSGFPARCAYPLRPRS